MTTFVQDAANVLATGSLYTLFALGVAFIYGVARIINFAHGAFIAAGGYLAYLASGLPWPFIIAMVLFGPVIVAVAAERVAYLPVRTAGPTTFLIMSFALSSLIIAIITGFAGTQPVSVNLLFSLLTPLHVGGIAIPRLDLVIAAVTVVIFGALAVLVRRTPLGVHLRAVSEDPTMAQLLGVRTGRVIQVAFGISGLLAGVAALLLVVQSGSLSPDTGTVPVLFAFVATIVGGLGSMVGAVAGGYLIGAVTVILQLELPVSLRPLGTVFVFAFVIAVLLVRPHGLVRSHYEAERA
jgi:branched-chain amino acid transport system permease protein